MLSSEHYLIQKMSVFMLHPVQNVWQHEMIIPKVGHARLCKRFSFDKLRFIEMVSFPAHMFL